MTWNQCQIISMNKNYNWTNFGEIFVEWLPLTHYIPKNLPQVSPKQIPITIFILLDNFYFNNIAKKSFPGTKLGHVPDLVLRGTWTSPRCSWMSGNNLKSLFIWPLITFVFTTLPKSHSLGLPLVRSQTLQSEVTGPHPDGHWSWTSRNNLKQLLSSSPTTFVSTTLPKSHSLWLPLVRFQPLQSEAAGPRPDGHGLFAAILGWSVGQELSFDTLTLSLVSKLTKFLLFFFFFYLLKL